MSNQPVAVVTGSSRGIGRGIAVELAKAGYDIAINYAGNQEAAKEACGLVEGQGRRAEMIQASVAEAEDRRRLIDSTYEAFGRLDLLVNNAGIAPKARADMLELEEENYEYLMKTNLAGPFFLTQYAAAKMIEQRREGTLDTGRIVFVTSISSYTASINRADYCISKAGLSMAVKLYADRLARESVLVYEIRPGVIATDMTSAVKGKYDALIADGLTPQPRWGTPEDIGKAVSAIGQGYFDFSTGTVIDVDGGFNIQRL